jgi:hypothetical protein
MQYVVHSRSVALVLLEISLPFYLKRIDGKELRRIHFLLALLVIEGAEAVALHCASVGG